MRPTVAETIPMKNNIPLPIECLIMDNPEREDTWERSHMHYHEYIEILYPLQGDYGVLVNNEELRLTEHSLIIIDGMVPHTTRPIHATDNSHTLFCVKFLPQVLYSSKQSVTEMEYTIPYVFRQLNGCHLFDRVALENSGISEEIAYITKETQNNAFGYELALRSGVLRIFTWILRYWHEHSEHPEYFIPNNSASQMLQTTQKYVEANIQTATLEGAANACGLSYSYFSRTFRAYMRMSFTNYLNLARTNQAMRLLATTEKEITEIAYEVGFSSSSHFIQIFKKHKYTTPKQFRKMCASNTKNAMFAVDVE